MALLKSARLLLVCLLALAPSGASAERICLGPGREAAGEGSGLGSLARVAADLASGPPIARHLDALRIARGTDLCLETTMPECRGYYTPERNAIVLRAGLPEPVMALLIIHESRHLDQIDRGFAPDPRLSRRETVRHVFALEADAQAIVSHFAWESRAADPALWEGLLNLPNYGDIANAYAATREAGGTVAASALAAFEQWFASEWRRGNYYHATCSDYLDMLDATKRLEGTEALDPEHLQGLCRLANGTDYGCADSPKIGLYPPR